MAERRKVTLRLDPDVAAVIDAAVEAHPGQTITGYVQEAVQQRASRERRAHAIWDMWGPFTDEELQYAQELLDGKHRLAPGDGYRAAS